MQTDTPATQAIARPPLKIMVHNDRHSLTVSWPDGITHCLTAAILRRNCRSSQALRGEIDGDVAEIPDDIAITGAQLVGTYALNLVFSDGEHRGIYPWAYLRDIAAQEADAEGK